MAKSQTSVPASTSDDQAILNSAELASPKNWVRTASVIKLEPGQALQGKYLGPGQVLELEDTRTGEIKEVNTHVVETAFGERAIMGSYQLDRDLPKLDPGTEVIVRHNGQKDTRKGQRVNDYIVEHPKK